MFEQVAGSGLSIDERVHGVPDHAPTATMPASADRGARIAALNSPITAGPEAKAEPIDRTPVR